MSAITLTQEQAADLRNKLAIVLGAAELIAQDERAHPIIQFKAKTIARTALEAADLLKSPKDDTGFSLEDKLRLEHPTPYRPLL